MDDGKYTRSRGRATRNNIWKKIVKKTDYRIDIVLKNVPYDRLKEKEIEFIKLYGRIDLHTGTLSNLTDGGDGVIGAVVTDETKRKIKENTPSIKVMMFDVNNRFIHEYPSVKDTNKDGFHSGRIHSCIIGDQNTHKGHKFIKINDKLIHCIKVENLPYKINCTPSKIMLFNGINLEGVYNSARDLCRKINGFNDTSISGSAKGKIKSHNGYVFKRLTPTIIYGHKLPCKPVHKKPVRKKPVHKKPVRKKPIPDKISVSLYDFYGNLSKKYVSVYDMVDDGFALDKLLQLFDGTSKIFNGYNFYKQIDETYHGKPFYKSEDVALQIFDKNDVLIHDLSSLNDAPTLGFAKKSINNVLSGKMQSHKNHTFKRISGNMIHASPIPEKASLVKKVSIKKRTTVILFDPDGVEIKTYPSVLSMSEDGFTVPTIFNCLSKGKGINNKCTFKRIDEKTIHAYQLPKGHYIKTKSTVILFDKQGRITKTYDSANSMSVDGFARAGVFNSVSGRHPRYNGYIFTKINPFLIHGSPTN